LLMDMLVPLYKLDDGSDYPCRVADQGITIRRAMAYERHQIIDWVRQSFAADGQCWADECEVALSQVPATCYIATRAGKLLGFACFDATAKGMFGPTGTSEQFRGMGIGAALLVTSLLAMRAAGYAYAVIGGAGGHVSGFYRKVVAATEIAASEPGFYTDRLGPVRR
jgi:predicted GNAT family acetyltransferase